MEMTLQKNMNVSADQLWQILGPGFNDIHQWAVYVETSYANPDLPAGVSGRVCQVTGFGEATETLTSFDDQQRKLAFVFESKKNPFFIKSIEHVWQVTPDGDDRSVLDVIVTVQLMMFFNFFLGRMVGKMLMERTDMVMAQLKYFAENGTPQPIG